ncbi:MAG: DUF5017 domain-containing protein [Bacteroidales bacterium]|nr:DUF5017 domain-containing protein [Bacteroidales bacterium]
MKINKAIIYTFLGLALCACTNDAPSSALKVTMNVPVAKAGEPVSFKISGDADNIMFYSGEPGHEYNLRDRLYSDNDLVVDFVSYTDQSTGIHPNFQMLMSHDFDGVYTPEHVAAATWDDVTSLFTLPSVTGQNTPSGEVSLKNYIGDNKDGLVYFAFRYYDLDGTPVKNRWVVRSINITKVSPEGGRAQIADIKTAGWKNVILGGSNQWTLPGSQLLATGNTTSSDKDMWAVSAGFNICKAEPSTGIVLKNIATEVDHFEYTYDTPGEYEAVFASSSVWFNSENSSVTTVTVKVTE